MTEVVSSGGGGSASESQAMESVHTTSAQNISEDILNLGLLKEALLKQQDKEVFFEKLWESSGELNLEVRPGLLKTALNFLKTNFSFEQLTDLFAVDYSTYGQAEWKTDLATGTGFSRGCHRFPPEELKDLRRFAVVYQLLSLKNNLRIRVQVFLNASDPRVPSVEMIYPSANWAEREAFDLFGVLFEDHSDLRRILTDYGFIGYPFRKDFPISGHVEMRYDEKQKRVVYEPVEIEPRILVPRVIRHDNRYGEVKKEEPSRG